MVATILVGGVVGQVVAAGAAGSDEDLAPPPDGPITIDPAAGSDELTRTSAIRLSSDVVAGEGKLPMAAGGDTVVNVGGEVYLLVPKGFRVVEQDTDFVQVFGQKGYLFAYLNPKKTTLPKLITNNLTGLQNLGVEDLEITDPEAITVTGVKGAATLGFRGLLATQQGGSIPIEGFAYYFVREDGTGATAFALYGKGALKPKGKLATGYNVMLNTLVSTL